MMRWWKGKYKDDEGKDDGKNYKMMKERIIKWWKADERMKGRWDDK